jgi:GNAT superfamily N-acetyltransferase
VSSPITEPLQTVLAGPEHAATLSALFDAAGCPCHCRYWHFEGDKNAWLERCAFFAHENQAEQAAALMAGTADAKGIVALQDGKAVGWLKLAPRASLGKLLRLGAYRPLALSPEAAVMGIGCVLVHPEHRAQGVARAMIQSAVEHARALGARAIEAYPLHAEERLRDDELARGPEALYLSLGFVPLGAAPELPPSPDLFSREPTAAYPVLQRQLSPQGDASSR